MCCTLFLYACEQKNYSVEIKDGAVHINMHCPSIGIIGVNQVSYDGFTYEEVEREVFDKIRSSSYNNNYFVFVTLQYKDSYGNYYDGESKLVTTLNGADVKRYASYSYFRGKTHIADAFPWNSTNNNSSTNSAGTVYSSLTKEKTKCTYCSNGKIEKVRTVKSYVLCQTCQGTGENPYEIEDGPMRIGCPKCHYSSLKGHIEGWNSEVYEEDCPYCDGTGYIE